MKATYQDIQQLVKHNYPTTVYYTKGNPVIVGRGKTKQKVPRHLGSSKDYFFAVEVIGPVTAVRRLLFRTMAEGEPMEKMVTAVCGIMRGLYPDWEGETWLRETVAGLRDGEQKRGGKVKVQRIDLGKIPVLFIGVD